MSAFLTAGASAKVVRRTFGGFGNRRVATLFFFVELAQDLLDPILVSDGLVELKLQLGHAPQLQAIADVTPEEPGRACESLCGLFARLLVAHRRVVDARQLQVWRDFDACERDEPDTGVVHRAAAEQLAQLLSDLIADAVWSESHVAAYTGTATLSIEKTSITSPTLTSL